MNDYDVKLKELLSNLFSVDKTSKELNPSFVSDLAPLRGLEAIFFKQIYGKVFNKPTLILPCGCIFYKTKDSYSSIPQWVYISICIPHQVTMYVQHPYNNYQLF